MPELVLAILKYFFLLLIFIFLARAVRAMYLEVAGPRTTTKGARDVAQPRAKPGRPPDRVSITPADGRPRSYDIEDELIIGRSDKCNAVITDTYASQIHARIFRKDETVFIEDMGSTNGTFLNKKKVTQPLPVARGDRARIGKTTLEFKR